MKSRIIIMLIVGIFALSNVSFVTVHYYRFVTLEDIYKGKPFKAIVEHVNISNELITTEVDIDIRRMDNGKRLCLCFSSANKFTIDFARTLHEGAIYVFPQLFEDYNNHQPMFYELGTLTNKPPDAK